MMNSIQRAKGQIAIIVLAIIGIGISIYLTSVHYENAPLICSASGAIDCARVLSSSFSVVPGTSIPISIPGLLWCLVSGVLAFVAWRVYSGRNIRIAQFVWSALGLLTVLYLVYAELVRIHAICIWCTVLHFIILIMFLITLVQLVQPQDDVDDVVEEEEEATPPVRTMK